MRNITETTKKNIIFSIFGIFAISYVIYCGNVMIELPYLTWIDQMSLADKWLSGTMNISDLLSKYGEHGLLGNNILWLINVSLFHGSTLFDVVLNDIYVILCAGLFVAVTDKIIDGFYYKLLSIIGELLFLCSFIQGSSGAMETQVRAGIVFFVLTMFYIERDIIQPENCSAKKLLCDCILIFFSINVFGTLYSFAGVPLVWFICLFYRFYKKKSSSKVRNIISLVYFITIPVYIVQYKILGVLLQNKTDNSGLLFNLESFLLHPMETLKCICSWNANGVLGWAFHERKGYSGIEWLFIGGCVTLLTLIAIILFFRTRMYERTWFPLMGIMYSMGVCVLVMLGRSLDFEWEANYWYNTHIRVQIAGMVLILVYALMMSKKKWHRIIPCSIAYAFICMLVLIGDAYAVKRAPYEKEYYQNMQQYLFAECKEALPVDENGMTPLLHTLDMTWDEICILKKYDLSVYRYYSVYNRYRHTLDNTVFSTYILGDVMDFSLNGNNVGGYVLSGFSTAENDFTWTDGNNAEITFNIESENWLASDNLNMYIDVAAIYGESQRIDIIFNGQKVCSSVLTSADVLEVEMHSNLVKGENTLELCLPDARSPVEDGEMDERMLGIAIRNICIK